MSYFKVIILVLNSYSRRQSLINPRIYKESPKLLAINAASLSKRSVL